MKKLLLVFALIIVVSVAMFSCNNGAYDARPDVDYSSALNPASPDSGGTSIYLGTMHAVINSKKYVLSPAFYYIEEDGVTMRLIARINNDSLFHRTLRITFFGYDGVKTYDVTDVSSNPKVDFVMLDTSRVDKAGRKIYNTYTANTGGGLGYASVNILGEEGGHYRGNFYGRMHRVLPEKNDADTVKFDFSEFYFEKVAFPVPDEYKIYLQN